MTKVDIGAVGRVLELQEQLADAEDLIEQFKGKISKLERQVIDLDLALKARLQDNHDLQTGKSNLIRELSRVERLAKDKHGDCAVCVEAGRCEIKAHCSFCSNFERGSQRDWPEEKGSV